MFDGFDALIIARAEKTTTDTVTSSCLEKGMRE